MKAILAEAARQELADTVAYYDVQGHGLGDSFLDEFQAAVSRVEELPEAWQPLSRNTRRCRLRRFPYGLIYRVTGETVLIIAVAHLHREPDYWRARR
jgi:plasmid stabilization system protein ParE